MIKNKGILAKISEIKKKFTFIRKNQEPWVIRKQISKLDPETLWVVQFFRKNHINKGITTSRRRISFKGRWSILGKSYTKNTTPPHNANLDNTVHLNRLKND